MELLLIRHARPARVEGDAGPADPPLTDLGHRQAEALATWLAGEGVDGLCTSPLRRATETAAPVAARLGLEAAAEPCLAEYDASASSYVPIEELQAAGDPRWMQLPEDVAGFQEAVVEGIEDLVRRHQERSGDGDTDRGGDPGETGSRPGRLALICHGGVINVYTARVLGTAEPMYFLPGYTSISRVLAAGSGRRTLASLNETAHLRVAGVPLTRT